MRTPMTAISSCCASVLAACIAGALLWTVAKLVSVASTISLGVMLLAAAVIGFAAWAGAEVGTFQAQRGGPAGRHGMLLGASAALVTSALLGVAFGIAVTERADQSISLALLVVAMAVLSLLSGLAATLLSRPFALSSITAVACCILGGVAFGLSFGLQQAASHRPCPRHGFCLDPNPWFFVQVGLLAGALVGLAPGLLVWLALTIPTLLRRPPATASA